MNNKTVAIGVAVLFVLACARPPDAPVPPGPNPAGCTTQQLNLTLRAYSINLTPKAKKCVKAGAIITMRVHTPGNEVVAGPGDVTTEPKPGNPSELTGSNSADEDVVTFSTPASAKLNDEFSYFVKIKDLGQLDPIVKVVGGVEFLKATEWDQQYYQKDELDLPAETTP